MTDYKKKSEEALAKLERGETLTIEEQDILMEEEAEWAALHGDHPEQTENHGEEEDTIHPDEDHPEDDYCEEGYF